MKEINIIEQALNIAAKQGVFNIEDSYKIHTTLENLKKSYSHYEQEYNNRETAQKEPESNK